MSRRWLLALGIIVPSCGGTRAPEPATVTAWFESATDDGLDFVLHTGHREGRFLMPESLAGGGALFDMDGDGDLDAYLVQSHAGEDGARTSRLYENDGNGRFRDVSVDSGATLGAVAGSPSVLGMGVACGDYDRDGDTDLYVTRLGPNVLLRNDGQGRFQDVTDEAGVGDESWGTGAAFCDLDADGDLDLIVLNYLHWTPAAEIGCVNQTGTPDYCSPSRYNAPAQDVLYRNDGGGRFTDVTREAGLGARFGPGLGVSCGDFNGDRRLDVFVANDSTPNQLWLNQGELRFVDEALVRGCAVDHQGVAKAGMGVASPDVDDDGDIDILVGNLRRESDSFYRNDGGLFQDVTSQSGLAAASAQFTRFGLGIHDFDNDGLLDVFEATGRVARESTVHGDDPYAEPNLLFRGVAPGRFERLPDGSLGDSPARSARAAVFGDVDNDGGIDILVVNQSAKVELFRNRVPDRGHWLIFRVLGADGEEGLNATVSARLGERRVSREVRAAYSYFASNDPRVHFGLGAASGLTDVRVRWLDGQEERFGDAAADRIVILKRGAGEVRESDGEPGR